MSEIFINHRPLGEMLRAITTDALQQEAAVKEEILEVVQSGIQKHEQIAHEARLFAEQKVHEATVSAVNILTSAAHAKQSSASMYWGIKDTLAYRRPVTRFRKAPDLRPVIYGPGVSADRLDPTSLVEINEGGELPRLQLKSLRTAVAERLLAMDETLVIQAFDAVDETPMKTRATDPEGYDFGDVLGDVYCLHVQWL